MYSVVVNRYLSSSSFQVFPLLLVLSLTFSVGGNAIFALSLSQCRAVMWGDFAPSKFCCSVKFDLLGGLCLSILFFQGYTYISLQLNFCKISQKQLRKLRIFYCIFRSYIIIITLQYTFCCKIVKIIPRQTSRNQTKSAPIWLKFSMRGPEPK